MLIHCTDNMLKASHDTAIKQLIRKFIPIRHVRLNPTDLFSRYHDQICVTGRF